MFYKKQVSLNKRGDIISLFILFFSFIYPQLDFNQLIHLNTENILTNSENTQIQFSNNTDILFWTKDDSSKIYQSSSIVESSYKTKNTIVKYQLQNYYNIFKTSYDLLLFKLQKNYTSINSEILFNYTKNIHPILFIQLDDNKNKSYGFGVNILKNNLNIFLKYNFYKYTYSLYFNYDDYIFPLSFKRNEESFKINLSYNQSNMNMGVTVNLSDFNIDKSKFHELDQMIDNDDYKKYNLSIHSEYIFNKDRKIQLSGNIKYNQQSISLIDNNESIIKINNLEIDENKITIGYYFNKNKSIYNIGLLVKNLNFECTGRIRTSIISNNLTDILGAPIINNYDLGEIITYGIFYSSEKILNQNIKFFFNAMYLKDTYDITAKNDLINIFVNPEIVFEEFKYKSKDAIELGFELSYMIKKTNFILSFNQHIPLKINKNIINGDESSISNISYGGGKIQFLISKNI